MNLILKVSPLTLAANTDSVIATRIEAIAITRNARLVSAIDQASGAECLLTPAKSDVLPGIVLPGHDITDAIDRMVEELVAAARGEQAWQASAAMTDAVFVLRQVITGDRAGITQMQIDESKTRCSGTSWQAWPPHAEDDGWGADMLRIERRYAAKPAEMNARKLARCVFGRLLFTSAMGCADLPLAPGESSDHSRVIVAAMLMGKKNINERAVLTLASRSQSWEGVLARSPKAWGLTHWFALREVCMLAAERGKTALDRHQIAGIGQHLGFAWALGRSAEEVRKRFSSKGLLNTDLLQEGGPGSELAAVLAQALREQARPSVAPEEIDAASRRFVLAMADDSGGGDVDELLVRVDQETAKARPFAVCLATYAATHLGLRLWSSMDTRAGRIDAAYLVAGYDRHARAEHEHALAKRRLFATASACDKILGEAMQTMVPSGKGGAKVPLSKWVDQAIENGFTTLVALPRLCTQRVRGALSNGTRMRFIPGYELGEAYARLACERSKLLSGQAAAARSAAAANESAGVPAKH